MNQEIITLEKAQETIPAVEIQMKQCRRKDCLKFKPLKEFALNDRMKDGRYSYCKECVNKNNQAYLKKKHEKKLAMLKMDCINHPDESTKGLRQCQRTSCQKFKALNDFSASLSYPDGYLPFCKDCMLKGALKDAINKELAQKAIENYVHPDDIIFRPIPFDDFLKLTILHPHPMVSEYLFESRTRDYYVLPDDIALAKEEYCHGEPPSSFKDFIRLLEPDTSYQEEVKSILEGWNELAEVA